MKVVDLGHGGVAIEPETLTDSVRTLTREQLRRSEVNEASIDIYVSYIARTAPGQPVDRPGE
ncbi:MAG: hypothetical protein ABW175_20240 [Bradyrhizobium sp.]